MHIYICNSLGPKLVPFETNVIGKLQQNQLEFFPFPQKKGHFGFSRRRQPAAGFRGSHSGFLEITKPWNTRIPGTFTSVDLKFWCWILMLLNDDASILMVLRMVLDCWDFEGYAEAEWILRMILNLDDLEIDAWFWWLWGWCWILVGFPLLFHPEMLKSGKWSLTSESPSKKFMISPSCKKGRY